MSQTEYSMSQTDGITVIIIIGIIALVFLILALFYMIFAYRKIGIVAKKIDYLVEDLTYKTEVLTPTIDALSRLANYMDLFESIINMNADSLARHVSKNKSNTKALIEKLKEITTKE